MTGAKGSSLLLDDTGSRGRSLTRLDLLEELRDVVIIEWQATRNESKKDDTATPDIGFHAVVAVSLQRDGGGGRQAGRWSNYPGRGVFGAVEEVSLARTTSGLA